MNNIYSKKYFFILFCFLFSILSMKPALADVEFSLRTGGVFNIRDWEGPQFKTGVNIGFTGKGANPGFYTSTSIDFSLSSKLKAFYITPEFQYDIKMPKLPMYIYPKFGINLMFIWWPKGMFWEDLHKIGLGLKTAFGVKFDITKKIFCYLTDEEIGIK